MRRLWHGVMWLFAGIVAQAATGLAAPLTLESLKAALARHPEARWQAGDTAAAGTYGQGHGGQFGLAPSYMSLAPRRLDPAVLVTPAGLPNTFDWRNKDGKNWLTPVRNQARCGSCVAFAAVGAFEAQYNIAAGTPGFDVDFSEQDLFARIGACAQGSTPDAAVEAMQSDGIPDEACSPYVSGRMGEDQSTSSSCSDVASRAVRINGAQSVAAEDVKAALQKGPLMTTMTVYEDFMFYTGGVYRHVTGDSVGGHAIVIIGYDDAAQAFIVRNSWGREWGEGGYFRIAYDDESGLGFNNYGLSVVNHHYVKVEQPTTRQVLSGTVTLAAANPRQSNLGTVSYSLSGTAANGDGSSGVFDPKTLSATIDTTALADGAYVLKAVAQGAGEAARPWYQTVAVLNHPETVTLTLTPDFPADKPVKDRVYFLLKASDVPVTLTKAVLHLEAMGGKSVTRTYDDPGTASKLGWRTRSFPNGTYKIYVTGDVGSQQFRSNELTVDVAN